jgi:hypothetical protein
MAGAGARSSSKRFRAFAHVACRRRVGEEPVGGGYRHAARVALASIETGKAVPAGLDATRTNRHARQAVATTIL